METRRLIYQNEYEKQKYRDKPQQRPEDTLEAARNVFVTNAPRPGDSLKELEARANRGGILGTQVGGSHYTDLAIQPIEYIWANNIGFSEGNVIKYVSRWRSKGGIKDLEKAHHHLALLIEQEKKKTSIGGISVVNCTSQARGV